jgi:hypothetical protein
LFSGGGRATFPTNAARCLRDESSPVKSARRSKWAVCHPPDDTDLRAVEDFTGLKFHQLKISPVDDFTGPEFESEVAPS